MPDVVSAVVRISPIFRMNCLRLPKASMAAIKEAHSTSAMVAPERRVSGDWEGEVEPVRGVSLSVYQRKNWLGSAFTKEATSYFRASSCRRDFNTDVISKFSLNAELPAGGLCGLRGEL